jgi:hypothetical protein
VAVKNNGEKYLNIKMSSRRNSDYGPYSAFMEVNASH